MTESPPAGWYPGADDYLRYWTGERWSDHTAPAGRALPPPNPSAQVASGTPRSSIARILISAVILGSLTILANRAAQWGLAALSLPSHGVLRDWGALGLLALVLCLPAARVGYRKRDAMLLLIPFYSFFLACRIVWRIAYLPFADWLPREEDAANWRQVPHPTLPGELLYARIRRE
ncbi:DUF2510 domain-containing protein [Catellatospora bangladeshensis]|uniref:DUF2510 domain-containing protein n=1 Tax=Catellatospora bangladeshensis TaxID=310355 RepID=A0A8J3NIH1_9ACTN|nr:DUF2510 domain-containing protein [Catellatospora bangladeshensis]GIF82152.1 hypothetical protein Cba03nite_35010 [Catellatospora bangladeshensis]